MSEVASNTETSSRPSGLSAHVSIAGPIVGIIILMTSVYHIYLAVFNYLSDSYLIYASSALAAQSFCRNMVSLENS